MPAWMGLLRSLSHYPDSQQQPNWPFTAPCFTHSAHFYHSGESFSNVLWKVDTRARLLFSPPKQHKMLCHCRSLLNVSMDAAFVSLLLPLLLRLFLFLFSFSHCYFFSCICPEQSSCSTAHTNTTLPLVYLTLKGRIHNALNLCYKIILSYLNVSKAKLVSSKVLTLEISSILSILWCNAYFSAHFSSNFVFICISALLWNLHQCIKLHHCHKKTPGSMGPQLLCSPSSVSNESFVAFTD